MTMKYFSIIVLSTALTIVKAQNSTNRSWMCNVMHSTPESSNANILIKLNSDQEKTKLSPNEQVQNPGSTLSNDTIGFQKNKPVFIFPEQGHGFETRSEPEVKQSRIKSKTSPSIR
jgi:hypothetical protein